MWAEKATKLNLLQKLDALAGELQQVEYICEVSFDLDEFCVRNEDGRDEGKLQFVLTHTIPLDDTAFYEKRNSLVKTITEVVARKHGLVDVEWHWSPGRYPREVFSGCINDSWRTIQYKRRLGYTINVFQLPATHPLYSCGWDSWRKRGLVPNVSDYENIWNTITTVDWVEEKTHEELVGSILKLCNQQVSNGLIVAITANDSNSKMAIFIDISNGIIDTRTVESFFTE